MRRRVCLRRFSTVPFYRLTAVRVVLIATGPPRESSVAPAAASAGSDVLRAKGRELLPPGRAETEIMEGEGRSRLGHRARTPGLKAVVNDVRGTRS